MLQVESLQKSFRRAAPKPPYGRSRGSPKQVCDAHGVNNAVRYSFVKKIENQFFNLGRSRKVPTGQKAQIAGGQEKKDRKTATEMSTAFKVTR